MLVKLLNGSDNDDILQEAKQVFGQVQYVKPKSSRSESSEIYVLCRSKL